MGVDPGFAVLGFCGVGTGFWAGVDGEDEHFLPFVDTHVLRPFISVSFALVHSVQSKGILPQVGFTNARAKILFDHT